MLPATFGGGRQSHSRGARAAVPPDMLPATFGGGRQSHGRGVRADCGCQTDGPSAGLPVASKVPQALTFSMERSMYFVSAANGPGRKKIKLRSAISCFFLPPAAC